MAGAYDTDGRSLRESLEEEEGEYQVPLLFLTRIANGRKRLQKPRHNPHNYSRRPGGITSTSVRITQLLVEKLSLPLTGWLTTRRTSFLMQITKIKYGDCLDCQKVHYHQSPPPPSSLCIIIGNCNPTWIET